MYCLLYKNDLYFNPYVKQNLDVAPHIYNPTTWDIEKEDHGGNGGYQTA